MVTASNANSCVFLGEAFDEEVLVRGLHTIDRAEDRPMAGHRHESARHVVRQRLAATVENDPIVRRFGDNPRENGEGAVVPASGVKGHLRAVVIDVIPRPQFGQSGLLKAVS